MNVFFVDLNNWLSEQLSSNGCPPAAIEAETWGGWFSTAVLLLRKVPAYANWHRNTQNDLCFHHSYECAGRQLRVVSVRSYRAPRTIVEFLEMEAGMRAWEAPRYEEMQRVFHDKCGFLVDELRGKGVADEDICRALPSNIFTDVIKSRRFPAFMEELAGVLSRMDVAFQMAKHVNIPGFHFTFPEARARGRKLIAILGPTNSGKTHQAFEILRAAKSGVYLAPLRLMAAEGWDRLNEAGTPCSLLTGEERITTEGARHVCSTVEMLLTSESYDVAVVDEVQMVADGARGWAWTNAILGANADTVVLLGSPDVEAVLRNVAAMLGEPLEIRKVERMTPLEVASTPLRGPLAAEPGSAFISFSRSDVLSLKSNLLKGAAAIYGGLSPAVRRAEAKRFADGEVQFLSATDAIGMGLNLPIRQIVFTTLIKWNGVAEVALTNSEIRQIAGRAGRFGFHEAGLVTAMSHGDLKRIKTAIAAPYEALPVRMCVAPHTRSLVALAKETGLQNIYDLLLTFSDLPHNSGTFQKADLSPIIELGYHLRQSKLSVHEQFILACCPVEAQRKEMLARWFLWKSALEKRRPISVERLPAGVSAHGMTSDSTVLLAAESAVRLLGAYKWLHYHFNNVFPDIDEATAQMATANRFIANSLRTKISRRCPECGAALAVSWRHRLCDDCFHGFRR